MLEQKKNSTQTNRCKQFFDSWRFSSQLLVLFLFNYLKPLRLDLLHAASLLLLREGYTSLKAGCRHQCCILSQKHLSSALACKSITFIHVAHFDDAQNKTASILVENFKLARHTGLDTQLPGVNQHTTVPAAFQRSICLDRAEKLTCPQGSSVADLSAGLQWSASGSGTVCSLLGAARRLLLSGGEATSPSPLQPRGAVVLRVSCSDGSMTYHSGDYPVSQTALWSLQCLSLCACVRCYDCAFGETDCVHFKDPTLLMLKRRRWSQRVKYTWKWNAQQRRCVCVVFSSLPDTLNEGQLTSKKWKWVIWCCSSWTCYLKLWVIW